MLARTLLVDHAGLKHNILCAHICSCVRCARDYTCCTCYTAPYPRETCLNYEPHEHKSSCDADKLLEARLVQHVTKEEGHLKRAAAETTRTRAAGSQPRRATAFDCGVTECRLVLASDRAVFLTSHLRFSRMLPRTLDPSSFCTDWDLHTVDAAYLLCSEAHQLEGEHRAVAGDHRQLFAQHPRERGAGEAQVNRLTSGGGVGDMGDSAHTDHTLSNTRVIFCFGRLRTP